MYPNRCFREHIPGTCTKKYESWHIKVSEEALANLPTQTPLGNIDIRALIPIALLPAPYGDFSGELRALVIGFYTKTRSLNS